MPNLWSSMSSPIVALYAMSDTLVNLASDNGLAPVRHQAITQTNEDFHTVGPKIWIKIPSNLLSRKCFWTCLQIGSDFILFRPRPVRNFYFWSPIGGTPHQRSRCPQLLQFAQPLPWGPVPPPPSGAYLRPPPTAPPCRTNDSSWLLCEGQHL